MNDPTPLVVANLKANKTWDEISGWLDQVSPFVDKFSGTVVVCPTSAYLAAASHKLQTQNSKLKLGSQDISKFEQGAYTGELAASQITDICRYAIVGHSERRQNFAEDESILSLKVKNAKAAGIEPIFCVQSANDTVPKDVTIVAYEPIFAIGTGKADTPESVKEVASQIQQKGAFKVIYGGSVDSANVKSYLVKGLVDGVLVGATNSVDPQNFIKILKTASY